MWISNDIKYNFFWNGLCAYALHPHVVEPAYWGAVETVVSLESCADLNRLQKNTAQIIRATDRCAEAHRRCRKLIAAAASLLADNAGIAKDTLDSQKVLRYADALADREFVSRPESGNPPPGQKKESRRFLSAVTPEGIVAFTHTVPSLCARIYAIQDDYGAAAGVCFSRLRQRALEAGETFFSCPCPLSPHEQSEHLLLSSAGIGFTTSNIWHKVDYPVYRRIHATRFYHNDKLRAKKQMLSFNIKAAKELLSEAVLAAREAKSHHDDMERFHIEAMDWQAVEKLKTVLIQEIEKLYI